MDTDSLALSPYQLGGALKFDHPTYVTRDADREIYEALKRGDFCYVLNSLLLDGQKSVGVIVF